MSNLSPLPKDANQWLRLDNLLVGALVLTGIGWLIDFLGCRFGYRFGLLGWLYTTLEPLGLGIAVFCALVGAILLVFRRTAAAPWLVTAALLLILPRVFEHYAPALCVPG